MTAKKDTRKICVLDSETDPFKIGRVPEPFIWGFYDGSDYREFLGSGDAFTCSRSDIDDLVDWFVPQDIIVYAHNGGKFDYHFLSHRFEPDTFLLVINGRLARFKIGNCEFRDSFNLLPVALEQYNKMKFDYTKMERSFRAEFLDEIRTYLVSDCHNLYNMVTKFIDAYGRHITQASAAMYYWQRTLHNSVPRSGPTFYENMKPYYYGGRVQCFEQGDFEVKAKSVDINSAYPYAMLSAHPYSLEKEMVEGKPNGHIDNWGPMMFCVECIAHGCFPYRANNQSLYFPDDDVRRVYYVTGWEVIAAIETETVEDIQFLYHTKFQETRDFSRYVELFWNLRLKAKADNDKGQTLALKIMLNALYGKFAMDPRKHKQYTLKPRSEFDREKDNLEPGDSIKDFREWLIVAKQYGGFQRGRFYNLATSASITGYVRAMLWRAIRNADRPLYCDTDSITAVGFDDDVILGPNLGQWEIENKYDRVILAGKKLYAMHKADTSLINPKSWKVASKGARLNHYDLIKIAAGDIVHYEAEAPTFSASKKEPTFIERDMKKTASDIRIVPRRFDPMFED